MREFRGIDPDVVPGSVWFSGTDSIGAFRRFPDGEYIRDGARILLEAKMGRGAQARSQLARDKALIAEGVFDGAEWHYFASDLTGRIGPSQYILDSLLERDEIEVVTHLPRG
ncbi:hypothetical protein OEB99_13115 [Actinotalea sp. M2MS4P-6]|uniref:hypothetical protein n=1 Tax=Actinotalea sp. M2MS4P-6 TaxID=2983762 RepID=UPI0021E3F761|nr:hypothetical protein [Actinotalea sp. M2MS4P-6]MCV2395252.1 hypothetical protein [Actinotalea sp. M2MS4P-6]